MNSFTSGYKTYDPETEGYGNSSQWRRSFRDRMSPDEAETILEEDNPYKILGVGKGSRMTLKELKTGYRTMAMKWHPDRNPNNIDQATEMMKKINAAYDYLCWKHHF